MSKRHLLFLPAAALWLGACATTGKKEATPLELAQLAVARADEARVGDYAGQEMRAAREKLVAARDAARTAQGGGKDAHDAELASRRLAEESSADTALAIAQASGARMQAAIIALQQQLGMVQAPRADVFSPDAAPPVVPAPDELLPSAPPALPSGPTDDTVNNPGTQPPNSPPDSPPDSPLSPTGAPP